MNGGLRMDFQGGTQNRAGGGEEGQVWSGSEGDSDREAKRNGLAERLFDPVERGGESVGQREKIEEEGAGIGFLEIGSKGGDVCAQGVLVEALKGGVGGKKGELRAAGEGSRGGQAGSDAVVGGGRVDSKKEWCGAGLPGSGERPGCSAHEGSRPG